jgi:3-oxoacyl-[acyl-carrier protein] reductase
MDLMLAGRTGLVTGASAGIGSGIATALAREGVSLAVTARRREGLDALADRIERAGGPRPAVLTGDLTDGADVARIAEEAVAALGQVDILVNNAGASRPLGGLGDDATWDEAMSLNFTSTRRLTEHLLPAMRARRWGRIVNITGLMEPRTLNAATAAKAAVHLWAKGLACDVAKDGVTVNSIPPGRINSDQILNRLYPTEESRADFIERHIPMGHFGEPEDIGNLVAYLASPLAAYITGNVIPVDGGMHFFGA